MLVERQVLRPQPILEKVTEDVQPLGLGSFLPQESKEKLHGTAPALGQMKVRDEKRVQLATIIARCGHDSTDVAPRLCPALCHDTRTGYNTMR